MCTSGYLGHNLGTDEEVIRKTEKLYADDNKTKPHDDPKFVGGREWGNLHAHAWKAEPPPRKEIEFDTIQLNNF